jgi:hypothetical protein
MSATGVLPLGMIRAGIRKKLGKEQVLKEILMLIPRAMILVSMRWMR